MVETHLSHRSGGALVSACCLLIREVIDLSDVPGSVCHSRLEYLLHD